MTMGSLNPPIRQWKGKTVWIIGASSGIGRATAAALHREGACVIVSARKVAALDDFVREHSGSQAVPLDATDRHAVLDAARQLQAVTPLDVVMYCAGHYEAMRSDALNVDDMVQHMQVNYVGALHVLEAVLPALFARGTGHISLVGSVAGYRGLPQSLAFGPTKAALANLAETLYLDLHDKGIAVSLVSPGFVETPLTAHNEFPMPALISPEIAAQEILKGWATGEFEIHFPKRFTRIMQFLRVLPYKAYFSAVKRVTHA